jgi:hypothetical protein
MPTLSFFVILFGSNFPPPYQLSQHLPHLSLLLSSLCVEGISRYSLLGLSDRREGWTQLDDSKKVTASYHTMLPLRS